MTETVVYGCDWCQEIVPLRTYGERKPDFRAKVTFKPTGLPEQQFDICGSCAKAFQAVSQGKFKR